MPEISLNYVHFSNILFHKTVFELHVFTSWAASIVILFLCKLRPWTWPTEAETCSRRIIK